MRIEPGFMMLSLPLASSLFAWEKDREKFCPSMAFFWSFDRLNSLLKILSLHEPRLRFAISFLHMSFCISWEIHESQTSHISSHTSRWIGILSWQKQKSKHMLVLCPNALSMPLFHFAIMGEKFHDLEFLLLNEFLK